MSTNRFLALVFPMLFLAIVYQQYQIFQLKTAQFAAPTDETVRFTAKDELCLAKNIFYEAGIEGPDGKYSVAQVTINRLRDGRWGNTICKVVYAKHQFSWTSLKKRAKLTGDAWLESQWVARQVLHEGYRVRQLTNAMWYHNQTVRPIWARAVARLDQIGRHTFYTEKT